MTKRKYIIYLTTNLDNEMVYKGVHLNKKLDPYEFDGYLGSGVGILEAIKEFGKKNFKRETLFVFNTKEEAIAKEKIEIPIEFVNDPNTYNRIKGGGEWPVMVGSDNPFYGKTHTIEWKINHSGNKHWASGKSRSTETKEKIGNGLRNHYSSPEGTKRKEEVSKKIKKYWKSSSGLLAKKRIQKKYSGSNGPFYGKHHKEEAITKIKDKNEKYWNSLDGEKTKRRFSVLRGLTSEIVKQRLIDIRNIEKVRGWKAKLSSKWGINSSNVSAFIKKYAPEYVNPPLYPQRILDIKNAIKTHGWKVKLAKKWNIKAKSAWKFINKYSTT